MWTISQQMEKSHIAGVQRFEPVLGVGTRYHKVKNHSDVEFNEVKWLGPEWPDFFPGHSGIPFKS